MGCSVQLRFYNFMRYACDREIDVEYLRSNRTGEIRPCDIILVVTLVSCFYLVTLGFESTFCGFEFNVNLGVSKR